MSSANWYAPSTGSASRPGKARFREITGLKAGIIGLGQVRRHELPMHSGSSVRKYLNFARSEKEWAREKGYRFLPLDQLLEQSESRLLLPEQKHRPAARGRIPEVG